MSLKTKRLNDVSVKKLRVPHVDKSKVKGNKLFDEIFANVNIVARKRSGKTNLIYNILKKCSNKTTAIHIFCSTCLKDRAWVEIIKFLESRGNPVYTHTSIVDEEGLNLVEQFMIDNSARDDTDSNSDSSSSEDYGYLEINKPDEEEKKKKRKPRKPKWVAPDHILIFDDLSTELKDKHLSALYKQNRHYRAKVITSSQGLLDIPPMSRKQQDYWILMKGLNQEKIEIAHKDADIGIPFNQFQKVYKEATIKPYSFLYIDTRTDTYRTCFDTQIMID
jgi:predicted transcriptional regulator